MPELLFSLLLFGLGAVGALVFTRRARLPVWFGAGGAAAGCLTGLVPALRAVLGGPAQSLRIAWAVPYGSLYLELDALSGFFLLPVLVLCGLCAVYGAEYLEDYRAQRSLAPAWFFFNLLVASMVVVVLARNGVLFIVAWEMMALSSFFLVTFEDEKAATRQAGWVYLVASHLGTAFLLVLFILLGRANHSLDFNRFTPAAGAGVLFVLALVGFGTKAGFVPLHVWLPEAHPAAPSHVSAVMSAVMIKTGIYGLLRVLTFLGAPAAWWGWLLCGVGLTSGLCGIALALAQEDIKRLLAYSSVENAGIIALGLGVGLVGVSKGASAIAVIGFAGALLHVVNHSVFKGLLFLGAGNILHSVHTRDLDALGGLLKRMPRTAVIFLVGAAAIAGLPPLNGFASEFLIYLAGVRGAVSFNGPASGLMFAAIGGLALIGALAAACFTKLTGIAFLGEPRSLNAERAQEAPRAMLLPGLALAVGCILIGLFGAGVVEALGPSLASTLGLSIDSVQASLAGAARSLAHISYVGGGLIGLALLLAVGRAQLLTHRSVSTGVTWDCGYAQPSPRMQYTASSFVQPLTDSFRLLLQTRRTILAPQALFPPDASLITETPDPCRTYLYGPMFVRVARAFSRLRPLQQGKVQLYILYIALTLIAVLLWLLA